MRNTERRALPASLTTPFKAFTAALIAVLFLFLCPRGVFAAQSGSPSYRNPETGFCIWIQDDADLLSPEEESALLEEMIPVTDHCNGAFYSGYGRHYSTMDFAELTYRSFMNYDSGVLFLIDMYNREITMYSDGSAHRVITNAKSRSIMDNIYSLAVNGDYGRCAAAAFAQANTLLNGSRIAEPMKYLSNLLIALCTAFLLTYLFVSRAARAMKPSRDELLRSIGATFYLQNPRAQAGKTTRTFSPRVKVSGGSFRSSGGGGFSGGGFGGSSGGGGSHRF